MAILIETWEVIWHVNKKERKKKKKRTYEPKWLVSMYNRSATFTFLICLISQYLMKLTFDILKQIFT